LGEPVPGPKPGGHPANSDWLQWTDPLPIQEHYRDVKLKDSLKPEPEEPQGPRPDKLYKTIELEALAYEPAVLDSYEWFVVAAATHLGIAVGKRWNPEKSDKFRFNLLRSVHVHKKHQVHYEVRTYHRFINLHKLTGSTADTFLEYIERNLPEGVGLKVTKFEVMKVPEFLVPPNSSNNN
jgi:small subunit ribosomal protein S10